MEMQSFKNSKEYKILIGFAIVLGAIIIARTGYEFGNWLYDTIN